MLIDNKHSPIQGVPDMVAEIFSKNFTDKKWHNTVSPHLRGKKFSPVNVAGIFLSKFNTRHLTAPPP